MQTVALFFDIVRVVGAANSIAQNFVVSLGVNKAIEELKRNIPNQPKVERALGSSEALSIAG